MKVTKREQILIGALLLMLLGYSYYNFVYTKQNQKIAKLKASRDTYSQKWEQVRVKIASKDKKNEQNTILNAKIFNETEKLFPSIKQEEIIVVLDKMIKDSNLKADLLDFSEVSSENNAVDNNKPVVSQDKSKDTTNELDKLVSAFNGNTKKVANNEQINNTKPSTIASNSIVSGAYKMQVTFNFKGMYDELISFIDEVENYDKKIIINNINLNGAEGSDVSGTLILEFYGVPKLNNSDYLKWDYQKPSGNGNPFLGSSSSLKVNNTIIPNNQVVNPVNNQVTDPVNNQVNNGNEIITKNGESEIKSDFLMSAKPKTADLHTVSIEKAKDESKQSYIYSDNEKIEPVEFYFTKIGSKYFYKYKTSLETYPKDSNNSIEFVPNGENIILDILSQKRGEGIDLSGANIKITNNTDKSVVVNILDDDKSKPRVTILKEKGDISVVRNYFQYTTK